MISLPINSKNITLETENWSAIISIYSIAILERWFLNIFYHLHRSTVNKTFIAKANRCHCNNCEIKTGSICPSLDVTENQYEQNYEKTNKNDLIGSIWPNIYSVKQKSSKLPENTIRF